LTPSSIGSQDKQKYLLSSSLAAQSNRKKYYTEPIFLADYYKSTSLNPIPRKYSTTIQKLISIMLQQKKNKLVEILEQIKSYATTKNFSDKTTTIFHFAFFL